nr:Restriction endonuclease [uncultured bacterium]
MAYRYRRSRRSRTDTSFSTPAIVSLAIVSLVVVFGGYLSEQLTPQVLLITVGCLSFILIVTAWWLKQWWANLQLQRLKNLALNDIDQMSGVEFEKYVAKLLKAQGFYKVDLTPVGSDFGVDVTAWRENLKYAIQVKRYKGFSWS